MKSCSKGVLAFAAAFSCFASRAAAYDASQYARSYTFSDMTEYTVRWKTLTSSSTTLEMALELDVDEGQTQFWVGFGIARAGLMPGADIVVYKSSDDALTDSYAIDYETPLEDECNDWTLVGTDTKTSSITGKVKRVVEMSRKLDTTDPQDNAILDDSIKGMQPTKIIGAHGEAWQQHSPSDRSGGSTRFFGATNPDPDPLQHLIDDTTNNDVINVTPGNYVIYTDPNSGKGEVANCPTSPACKWEYYRFSKDTATLFGDNDPRFLIGIEHIVHTATKEHVHHLVVSIHGKDSNGNCDPNADQIERQVWAWAPGTLPLEFPENVGFRINDADEDTECVKVEIHYDYISDSDANSDTDDSGVRIVATKNIGPIMQEAGTLILGDAQVRLGPNRTDTQNLFGVGNGKLPNNNEIAHVGFTCPTVCTGDSTYFNHAKVTVIGMGHHMHAIGRHSRLQIVRNSQVVYEDVGDVYDFDANGVLTNQASFGVEIHRGDELKFDCWFKDKQSTFSHAFGQGSSDEMCMNFVTYYPKLQIPGDICGYSHYCGSGPSGQLTTVAKSKPTSIPYVITDGSDDHECPTDSAASWLASVPVVTLVAAVSALLAPRMSI